MRDFKDAKAMARTLRNELAAKGLPLTHAEALELAARTLGERDWNTLSAAIKTAGAKVAAPTWPSVAKRFYDRYLSDADRRVPGRVRQERWQKLFDEANALYAAGERPDSHLVLDLARRWLDYSWTVSGDDLDYKRKSAVAYNEALDDPETAPHLPITRDVLLFLETGFKAAWAERANPA